MLARELGADYHNFLGFGKGKKKKPQKPKKQLTDEERAARTERRQQLTQTVQQQMQEGSTLRNVLNMFKKQPEQPADYRVNVGNNATPPPTEETGGMPTGAIIAGVVVLGIVGIVVYRKMQAEKQLIEQAG